MRIDNLLLLHCDKFGFLPPEDIEEWIPFVFQYFGDNFLYKKHIHALQIIDNISTEELEASIRLNNSGFLKNCLFFNAILVASCAHDYEILIAIINKGINLNTLTNDIKKSGLEHAVNIFLNNDNFPVIKLLIDHGANIHLPFSYGKNFFTTFVFNSARISVCTYIKRNRPFITMTNFNMKLYHEYVKNNINIYDIYDYVLFILSKNCDYRIENNDGYSAKYYLENTLLERECLWSIRKHFLIFYEGFSNLGLAENPLCDINYFKEVISNM